MSALTSTYVGPREFRFLMYALGVIGAVAAVAGPAYAINGATQAGGDVRVHATVQADAFSPHATRTLPDDVLTDDMLPDGVWVEDDFDVALRAPGSTVAEQLLGRGDLAVLGLSVGIGALLLLPVLRSIAGGRPFEHGNARRIALVAVLLGVNGVVVPLLPAAATAMVLARTGADVEVFEQGVTFTLLPFALVAAVLVVAEAFRRGEQIADDVEGLV